MNNYNYNCGPSRGEQYHNKNQSKKKNYQRQTQNFGNQYYSTSRPDNSGFSYDSYSQLYYGDARPAQRNYNFCDSNYSNVYPNVPQSNSWRYHQVQNNNRAAVTFENVSEMGYISNDGQRLTMGDAEKFSELKNPDCSSVTMAAARSKSCQKETKPKRNYKEERAQKQRTDTLLKAFEKPVVSSKAERMMERMGWRGGALGLNGVGLVVPLQPHLTQINRSGLGLFIENNKNKQKLKRKPTIIVAKTDKTTSIDEQKTSRGGKVSQINRSSSPATDINGETAKSIPVGRKKMKKPRIMKEGQHARELKRLVERSDLRDFLKSSFLECIQEFVKDDRKSSLEFESSLTKAERYLVHQLVETMKEKDASLFNLGFLSDYNILEEIWSCNPYVLYTQSTGAPPDRKLVIYKEAPEHVYLITKDDLEQIEPEVNDEVNDESIIIIDDDEITAEADENSTAAVKETNEESLTETPIDTTECSNEITDDTIENIVNTESVACDNDLQIIEVNKMENVNDDNFNGNNKTQSLKDKLKREYENMISVGRVNVLETTQAIDVKNIDNDVTNVANDCNIEYTTHQNEDNIKIKNEDIQSSKEINVLYEVKKLLIKYLKEFIEDDKCTQIRFLGEFDEIECEAIDSFTEYVRQGIQDIHNVSPFIDLDDESVKDIFENEVYTLSVYLDENEHTVIAKTPRIHH